MLLLKKIILALALTACLIIPNQAAATQTEGGVLQENVGPNAVYLPLVVRADLPAFHIPFLDYQDVIAERFPEMAVFWFGRVTPTENYSDVRIGYNADALYLHAAVIDRLLWYDTTPSPAELTQYDAVTIYLDPTPGASQTLSRSALRIDVQFAPDYAPRQNYQAVYRWNGSAWASVSSAVTSATGWRSSTGGLNDLGEDRGWFASVKIPFSAFGHPGKPADGSRWKIAMVLHDRDASSGSPNAAKSWPPAMQASRPDTWKSISFGLPAYQPPSGAETGRVTIRNGLNGAVVPDGSVGGNSNCGEGIPFWTQWGNTTYNSGQNKTEANVQNQRDIADWPCFSKYYITFPLDQVPAGKRILSANLTLYQFGNAGDRDHPGDVQQPPYRSLIQIFRVAQDIQPATLTWNNAPLPEENVGRGWVDPLDSYPGWPGVARTFDLTRAVTEARLQNQPLRLALYSADGAYHSGKYFRTSDVDDSLQNARPYLEIRWTD